MTTKYRLKMRDIDTPSGIHKLERDGFSREQIIKTMYKETAGASKQERSEIVSKLFDRKE